MGTGSPCEPVQVAVVVGVAQQVLGLAEGGRCRWRRRRLGGVEGTVAKAGFGGADQRGGDEKVMHARTVAPVIEECRGSGLCGLELWGLAKEWSPWTTCGPRPCDRPSVDADGSLRLWRRAPSRNARETRPTRTKQPTVRPPGRRPPLARSYRRSFVPSTL